MDVMPWVHYDQELLAQLEQDGVIICRTRCHHPIYMARTLTPHEYYVPGYAVNGVGYFVSKEQQPFQTRNFQVLIGPSIDFVEFSQNEALGIVADNVVDESEQIKIGSFFIEGNRLCGMVDNQNTCYINLDDQVYSKESPEFQIPVELTSDSEEFDSDDEIIF